MTVYRLWPFSALGVTTGAKRKMPERLSDIVNVKDWGALGNNVQNDTPKIQAAVDYVISQGGGKVFFPPGAYSGGGTVVVGTNNAGQSGNGIELIGSGYNVTLVTASFSKGGLTYDLISKIEGLQVSAVITGTCVSVRNCKGFFDASAATNCAFYDGWGGTGSGGQPSDSATPFAQPVPIGLALGNSCTAVNWRILGGCEVAFALSGTGIAILGGSCETCNTAIKVGWSPAGGGTEVKATGVVIHGFQTERCQTALDLYNVEGAFISACNFYANHGNPTEAGLVTMSWSSGIVTVTTTNNHNLTAGPHILQFPNLSNRNFVEPAVNATGFLIFNATRHATDPKKFTYPLTNDPGAFNGSVTAMSWNSGSHVVTVSMSTSVPIPVGSAIVLDGMSPTWSPNSVTPFTVSVASSSTTQFTYAGPSSAPSGAQTGTWTATAQWNWPPDYGIRCRNATEVVVSDMFLQVYAAAASVDFSYGGATVVQRNNRMISVATQVGSANVNYGWISPAVANRAGWQFTNIVNGPNNLTPILGGSAPPTFPTGILSFANVPGGGGSTNQDGPFETQEFDIIDGSKSGFTPPTAALWNDTVIGGGNGRYRIRYDGTNWRRIG